MHIVILNERDMSAQVVIASHPVQLLKGASAGAISRMRFARKDKLDRAPAIHQQALQSFKVSEEKESSLVGGETASKTDGQRLWIEEGSCCQRMRGSVPSRIHSSRAGPSMNPSSLYLSRKWRTHRSSSGMSRTRSQRVWSS